MSGPKGLGYTVLSAEERLHRDAAAGRARCDALRAALTTARYEAAALAGARPAPVSVVLPAHDDLDAIGRCEVGLRDQLAAAESDLAARRSVVWEREAGARLVALMPGSIRLPPAAPAVPLAVTAEASGAAREQDGAGATVERSLRRVIVALGTLQDGAERGELQRRTAHAAELLTTSGALEAQAAVAVLEPMVAAAVRRQRERAQVREQARELALRLAAVPGTEDMRDALAALEAPEELARWRARVSTAVAEHNRVQDREFVVRQTADALRALGYEVDESFEVSALAGEATVAHRADLADHGVQFRFPTGAATMLTNVVALTDTTPAADVAAEASTCRDIDALRAGWSTSGIACTVTHHQPPGAVPVERAAEHPGADRRGGARSRRRPGPQERTLGGTT